MNIRRIAAIWAAKAAGAGCKLLGRQGVTWAGKIALKIYPPILQELAAEVRKDIFVVCGTNGKTTTNNMLCSSGGRREQSYLQSHRIQYAERCCGCVCTWCRNEWTY